MEKLLNDYLARVERYLKPLSASDRVDIVKEIKSEMLELLGTGVAPEQIVERLGDAKTLARAYLSDNVAKAHGWRRVSALIAFYSLAGLGGICVLPVTSICAAAFLFSGAVCPWPGSSSWWECCWASIWTGSDSSSAAILLAPLPPCCSPSCWVRSSFSPAGCAGS